MYTAGLELLDVQSEKSKWREMSESAREETLGLGFATAIMNDQGKSPTDSSLFTLSQWLLTNDLWLANSDVLLWKLRRSCRSEFAFMNTRTNFL